MHERLTQLHVALRGFGEAGSAFASGWNRSSIASVSAFDEKVNLPDERSALEARFRQHRVTGCEDEASAFRDADLIFSLVYADRALEAATATARHLKAGALYLDGNSCSPQTKARAAESVTAAGGHYVDMAIMAPVLPRREKTPVLLSGPLADKACDLLRNLGMQARVVGTRVGAASAIKLTRSIMIKGMEALFAECFLTARLNGVEDEVLASLEESDPDIQWRKRRDYCMERMTVHGRRRAAEMREAASMVAELGLPNDMAASTALWQQCLGDLLLPAREISDVLEALLKPGEKLP